MTARKAKRDFETDWILLAFTLIPIAITPFMNMDAINLIKMVLLSVFAFGSVAFIRKSSIQTRETRLIAILGFFFVVTLMITSFFSGPSFWMQFWGAQGRNSGILTHICFTVLFFVTSKSFDQLSSRKLIFLFPMVGVINVVYALIQHFGKDPVNWRNPYSPIVGTLGNPNFISSHLGLVSASCVIVTVQLWQQKSRRRVELSLILLVEMAFGLFVIWKSLSIQGFLVFGIVLASAFLFSVLVYIRNRVLALLFLTLSLLFGFMFSFGFLGKGPLGAQLYRESFIHRTNFWEAGINMLKSNLLTGVGIDQFGDFYREYRSLSAVRLRGPAVTTDSAHNVAIDIASGGGIFPLIFYVLFQILIFFLGLTMIKRLKKIEVVRIGVFSLWIGYQAQTMISINQIGVSIWGWILGGAVVALSASTPSTASMEQKSNPKVYTPTFNAKFVLLLLIGFVIALPPFRQDMSFRAAIATQNGVKIIEASKSKPENPFYLNYASILLRSNGYKDQALELTKRAIEINPRNFVGWKLMTELSSKGTIDYTLAAKTLRSLDPLNDQLPIP